MKNANINKLHALIEELRSKRETFASAIEEIDEAFQSLGFRPKQAMNRSGGSAVATRTQAAPARSSRSTPGRKYGMTAHDLVMDVVRNSKDGATGAEISRAWTAAGRSGEAYNTLGELVRQRMIKRVKVKTGRGSIYQLM